MHVRTSLRAAMAALCSATLLTACGPPTTGDTGPKGDTTHLQPLGIKDAAKAPFQALILGTDASGGSTVIPLREAESDVVVDVMWVKLTSPPEGGSTPVTLTTQSNADGKVRVGVTEEFAGGIGANWRAGVWLAAFVASTTLGKDLTDFKFNAESGGYGDGASGSGLMTAGFIAAMTGTPLDSKATMTGIINPDGTIGPVGGIPQKFKGSIAKGKTKLGFPVGARYAVDIGTGQSVDLIKLAKDNGVTAVEVSDVYGAYELMTGKKLPRPVPVDEKEMELEEEVLQAFEAKYAVWQAAVSREWDAILELDSMGRLPQGLITIALAARDQVGQAEKMRKQGLAPQAYKHMVTAWIYAASTTATSHVLEMVQAGDLTGAKAQIHEFEGLAQNTEPVLRKIGALKPDTMGGHLQMLSAYDRAIAGLAAYMHASSRTGETRRFLDSLRGVPPEQLGTWEVAEATVMSVAPTVLVIARAVANAEVALETMEIEAVKSLNYMCSLPNVRRLATSFQSASAANVTYFETFVGVKDDQTRALAANIEPDYLTAWFAANLPRMGGLVDTLKNDWGESSLAWGLMQLSSSQLAYFKASTLISKYYSLKVQNDPWSGRPVSVEEEKAFMTMLAAAERKARENARAAKVATGAIPVQARIAYQNARVLREGDLANKLQALETFWQSSAYSQTAVMLARN